MTETTNIIKGGAFLIEETELARVLTPEDFTDEQKMIAKTTEEYVSNEVMPLVEKLENHEFEHSVQLLKKAGELGLLAADVPEKYEGLGLDKVSSALITEKMAECLAQKAQEIVVPVGTLITPAAMDVLKEARITIIRR